MSLIIILLAIFNNFAIRRPYLLSQAPHIIVRPPKSENVATPLLTTFVRFSIHRSVIAFQLVYAVFARKICTMILGH